MKPIIQSRAVVIGAGLSGLAAARELGTRKISTQVLDAAPRIGEPWRARYPQLRLNIHRHFASLPGLAMTCRDGPFVRRDTVVEYLGRYAEELALPIHLDAAVTSIEEMAVGWRVITESCEYRSSHVIIATGRERVPYVPDWPGREEFTAEILHAADLGDVARFDGKRLLVVGAGNSGADVLNHLVRHAPAQLQVSVRHGPAIVPARVFGFPLHRLARVFAALPSTVLDPVFRLTQRLLLGNLARHGLNSHPDGGATRLLRDGIAFAIDDGFVAALRQGRVRVVPEVVGFDRDRVLLSGGGSYSPDAVICATGYRTGLEPLVGHLGVLDSNGQPTHPMGEAISAFPGLWFTGFKPQFTGYFDAAGTAADRIANGIESTADTTPSEPGHDSG